MMFLFGMAASLGLYLCILSTFDMSRQRSEFLRSIQGKLLSESFAYQCNVTIIASVGFSLVAGIAFQELVLAGTVIGFVVGWVFARSQSRKLAREGTLQLSLATATLAEDCAILSTTHLGIRQALLISLRSSHPELQRRVKILMEGESAQTLLANQLKEIANIERENALGRFARTLAIAVERGNAPDTSLFQLAHDIRTQTRRELMQLASKKEIAMMVPVVFAVLPSVTAVALFPAMKSLEHL